MKLEINARELLALYNVLYERFELGGFDEDEFKADDPRAATFTQLNELYKRIRACVIASLNAKMVDPLDSWLTGQQRRIDRLNKTVDPSAEAQGEDAVTVPVRPTVMSAEDTEVLSDSYPRRAPRPGGKPRR